MFRRNLPNFSRPHIFKVFVAIFRKINFTSIFTGSDKYIAIWKLFFIHQVIELHTRILSIKYISTINAPILRINNDNMHATIFPIFILFNVYRGFIYYDFGKIIFSLSATNFQFFRRSLNYEEFLITFGIYIFIFSFKWYLFHSFSFHSIFFKTTRITFFLTILPIFLRFTNNLIFPINMLRLSKLKCIISITPFHFNF